jgi:hypothetical protein
MINATICFKQEALFDTGWLSDTSASCASTTSTHKSDIINVWREGRRRTTGNKLGSAARRKRRQLKLDRLKPVPHWL